MEWVLGVGSLLATAIAGRAIGRALRSSAAGWYWLANGIVMVGAIGIIALSTVRASDLLFGLGLGLGFGGLAGLRQGCRGLVIPKRPAAQPGLDAPDDAGFTLIESLAAAGILLVVAGGVITTLIATGTWYADARARTDAASVAGRTMTIILARNDVPNSYVPDGVATAAVWPEAVPESREETTARGMFTVETSMTPVIDPATGVRLTRVVVTAYPSARRLTPPVSVTRYASGWQNLDSGKQKILVPVEVQCSIHVAGIRVQLLDPVTLQESRYSITDSNGLAVFEDVLERDDGYFLSADWRFGPNIRPIHFPERKIPYHGGSVENPIPVLNHYELEVRQSAVPALLRVGVYRHEGWRFQGGVPVSTPLPFSTIEGLTVYAQPVLNIGSPDTGMNGIGNLPHYPQNLELVWSGTVNAYGVACIEIPYTTDPSAGQYWRVWCTTTGPNGTVRRDLTCDTVVTGGWASGVANVSRPELPTSGVYSSIPQWTSLSNAQAGPPDPTPPPSPSE